MESIDEYIAQFGPAIQERLQAMRDAIRRAAPDAGEKISYGMPTFALYGNLVHFAAMKHHIGFYPGASGVEAFADKLKDFETSKGTIRLPFDRPLPLELIEEIVLFRVNQNQGAAWAKREKRKANTPNTGNNK
ncbi:MAG: DUF1801 domain-containing protein [Bacillota bacterium]